MIEKKYIKISIDKLIDYEKNNKIHNEYNIWEIVKSIEKCEYLSPIIIDEDFRIINWHWRKEALKKLNYDEIEVLQIIWLSDKQKKSARLLDNKINSLSIFDLDNIRLELDDIWDEEINELFSDIIFDKIDYDEIYKWMPEFNQQDLSAEYQIKVNFKELKDMEEFWKIIKQNITEKTRSIWFPAVIREDLASEKIVNEE